MRYLESFPSTTLLRGKGEGSIDSNWQASTNDHRWAIYEYTFCKHVKRSTFDSQRTNSVHQANDGSITSQAMK